jgi:hypothetical protein
MRSTYRVYGLHLGANRCIPGLTPDAAASAPDVEVRLGCLPPIPEPVRARDNEEEEWPEVVSGLPGARRGFRLRYEDGTVFIVDDAGCNVWAGWPVTSSLEDTAAYLLGPVLALVLRLRGVTCLHASAFAADGAAVALVGPSGAGKSTTAAAFAERGLTVLSDDVLALAAEGADILAQPGYPRLRLWPDAADLLYGDRDALPPLTPNWDKRFVDLQSRRGGFWPSSLALRAVYLLGECRDDTRAPCVEPLTASQALLGLLANCRNDFGTNRATRKRDFELLGQLVRRLPVRRVVGRAGPGSLSRLCDTIGEDLQFIHDRRPALASHHV